MRHIILSLILSWPCTLLANDTELLFYRPFTTTDKYPNAIITSTISGSCSEQSHHVVREDAWRCIADGKVYDPCFMKTSVRSSDVVCLNSPCSDKSLQIMLSEPLNNTYFERLDMSKTYPWCLNLQVV